MPIRNPLAVHALQLHDHRLTEELGASPATPGRERTAGATFGRHLRGFPTPEGEVGIWVRLRASDRENLEDLKSMAVGAGPGGGEILLSQVADLEIVKSPGVLQREDRRTYTRMFANCTGDKRDDKPIPGVWGVQGEYETSASDTSPRTGL